MMTDHEYAEHQRRAAEFSLAVIGKKEGCGCADCEEKDEYYALALQMVMARS
jgi:hypothetical protein